MAAEMGMIVYAEIYVVYNIAAGYRSKEAAHYAKKRSLSAMGSMYSPPL